MDQKWGRRVMAKKIVKNFTIDKELCEALERLSAARQESQSLIVREALRSQLKIGAAK